MKILNSENNEIDEPIFVDGNVLDNDFVIGFKHKIEEITYKHLIDKIYGENKNSEELTMFLPEFINNKFEIWDIDLSDIKEYKNKNDKPFISIMSNTIKDDIYNEHSLPFYKFKNYQKYSGISVSNRTNFTLVEIDLLTGRREILKQSDVIRGEMLINISEVDYSKPLESHDHAYNNSVGRKVFRRQMYDIVNENKYLYIPAIGKIYCTENVANDIIINEIVGKVKKSMDIRFFHDVSQDSKFAISCQDGRGSIDKLYAIIDDEIVDINIYNASGINSIFNKLSTDNDFLDLDKEKKLIENDNSNIWITKTTLDLETQENKTTHTPYSLSEEDYGKDTFIVDNIYFSRSIENLKKLKNINRSNNKKTLNELNELKVTFEELNEKFNEEIDKKKSYKSLKELYNSIEKKNEYLTKLTYYIRDKYPTVYTEIKDQFINIYTNEEGVMKENLKKIEELLGITRDELKYQHQKKLEKLKSKNKELEKEREEQRHRHKLEMEEILEKAKKAEFEYKQKMNNFDAKQKTKSAKADNLKMILGIAKVVIPIIIGGLAFLLGKSKMRFV